MLAGRRSGRATPLPTTMPQGGRGSGGPLVYQKQEGSCLSFFTNPLNQSLQCWCFALIISTILIVGVVFYLNPSATQKASFPSVSPRFKGQGLDRRQNQAQAESQGQGDVALELQKQILDLRNTISALRQDVRAKERTIDSQKRQLESFLQSDPQQQQQQQQQQQRQQQQQQHQQFADSRDRELDIERGQIVDQRLDDAAGRDDADAALPLDNVDNVDADVVDADKSVIFVKDFRRSDGGWEVCADADCKQKVEEPFVFQNSHQFTFSSPKYENGALILFERACPTDPVLQCQSNISNGKVTYNFTKKEAVFALCYCSPDAQNMPYEQHGTIHVSTMPNDFNANARRSQRGQRREI